MYAILFPSIIWSSTPVTVIVWGVSQLEVVNIIVVVDNISSDNSQKKCKEKFPDIKLIQNNENLGYCGGNNVGINEAKGKFIVILNPDTIIEPNCIDELILAYNKFGNALYQPKILSLNEKDIIQSTGNMLHVFGFGFARDKGNKVTTKEESIEKIGYDMLIFGDTIEKKFFLYGE